MANEETGGEQEARDAICSLTEKLSTALADALAGDPREFGFFLMLFDPKERIGCGSNRSPVEVARHLRNAIEVLEAAGARVGPNPRATA